MLIARINKLISSS